MKESKREIALRILLLLVLCFAIGAVGWMIDGWRAERWAKALREHGPAVPPPVEGK